MRQAASDAMLMVITANVLLSGLWDWLHGSTPVMVPLPPPLNTWHKLSSIVLLFAILVHLWRRRRRFRRSVIR